VESEKALTSARKPLKLSGWPVPRGANLDGMDSTEALNGEGAESREIEKATREISD